MKKVAVSVGDLNGIGIEIALKAHDSIKELIEPIYCIDQVMLTQAANLLGLDIPDDFNATKNVGEFFDIAPGKICAKSGAYSFSSFKKVVTLAQNGEVDAICTLPINKKAWELAGIRYKGHTDALRDFTKQDAIMMLGCAKLYVALFTEHIPLQSVASEITKERLVTFLNNLAKSIHPKSKVGVLGLNPHAGDNGVLGEEENSIRQAIKEANEIIGKIFYDEDILVPDIAFTPHMRERYSHLVAMYHDQGLAPLKALYFEESINVSLNLPFLRTSVDHGTAFDIAYKKERELNTKSYINAIQYIAMT